MIYVTGDTHIPIDGYKLLNIDDYELNREDYVIVCGDFGLLWKNQPDNDERKWTKLIEEKNYSLIFICGNHENHYRLDNLKLIDKFGSKVGYVADNIFHLRRGEIYNIDGYDIFTFGGAVSIDKHLRTEGISWWPREVPNYAEMDYGLANLELHGNKVDFVVTHTAPQSIVEKLNNRIYIIKDMYGRDCYTKPNKNSFPNDPTCKYLEEVRKRISFKYWYCGHFHKNIDYNPIRLLYEDIVRIV